MPGCRDLPPVERVDASGRSKRDGALRELGGGLDAQPRRCAPVCRCIERGSDLLIMPNHRDREVASTLLQVHVEIGEAAVQPALLWSGISWEQTAQAEGA